MTEIAAADYGAVLGGSVSTDQLDTTAEGSSGLSRARDVLTSPTVAVYAGIVLVGLGFGLLGYTWSKVSLTVNVGLQIPYVISGGFVGLGLIMTGLLLLTVNARRADAAQRERQLAQLVDVVRDLGDRLDRFEGEN